MNFWRRRRQKIELEEKSLVINMMLCIWNFGAVSFVQCSQEITFQQKDWCLHVCVCVFVAGIWIWNLIQRKKETGGRNLCFKNMLKIWYR